MLTKSNARSTLAIRQRIDFIGPDHLSLAPGVGDDLYGNKTSSAGGRNGRRITAKKRKVKF